MDLSNSDDRVMMIGKHLKCFESERIGVGLGGGGAVRP